MMQLNTLHVRIGTSRLGVIPAIRYALGMQGPSDEQLMMQYAAGKVSAFEELYGRYKGPLFRYYQRQVSDAVAANDLFQGCWEKLIKARASYRETAPFRAWLFRIAHNHLVDYFRAQKPLANSETDTLASDSPQPAESLQLEERRVQFEAALACLPFEQKHTLLLKVEAGLSLEEIGKITGVERETVKSRLRYAMDKLKRTLQS